MTKTISKLIDLLKQDERLVVDNRLAKNKIIELALQLDSDLLKLLKSSKEISQIFFQQVDDILIFDKVKFQSFVSSKQFLPDSFTEYKNKIGLISNKQYLADNEEVVLAFPYKDCVLEGGQTKNDSKRNEVFWNETLAPDEIDKLLEPKVLTNFEKYKKGTKSKLTEISIQDNLLIKGNNLLSLYSLREKYRSKIKLIYIDPPYNPDSKSNTFIYNNNFNESTWLTFMKNRLEVAKDLLTADGSLIVAIDDNEHLELGLLLKELFKTHEIHCITIVHNPRGVQGANFSYTHEYAFFVIPKGKNTIGNRKIKNEDIKWSNFRNWGSESERSDAKNCFYSVKVKNGEIVGFGEVSSDNEHPKQTIKQGDHYLVYPIDVNGIERKWRYARQSVEEILHLLKAKKVNDKFEIEIGKDFGTYKSVWIDSRYDANEYGTKIVKSLVPNCKFDFPKSIYNVYDCLYAVVGNDKNAIILDFFGGSGTTAHSVLMLNKNDEGNRKFIICEQMDYIETITKERIRKVTEKECPSSFIYAELKMTNGVFINKIQDSKTSKALLKVWNEMKKTAFLSYKVKPEEIDATKKDFKKLSFQDQQRFLISILDKNLLYVPYSEIDDKSYGISQEDKDLNNKFYGNK